MRKQLGIYASLLLLCTTALLWVGCSSNRCCNTAPVCEQPCQPVCAPQPCMPVCAPQPCAPVCPPACPHRHASQYARRHASLYAHQHATHARQNHFASLLQNAAILPATNCAAVTVSLLQLQKPKHVHARRPISSRVRRKSLR